MRWLCRSVLGVVGATLAMLAGGCASDDYYHDHERARDRPVVYWGGPPLHGWREYDLDRHYDRRWENGDWY
jgi:hypothetical protein